MDPRLASLFAGLKAARFADLSGSEAYTVVKISERLLNESTATFLAGSSVVREIKLHPRAANQIDVQVKLAKPAFLPAFNVTLHVEQQPRLPDHPEVVLRLSGAGGLLRLAGPAIQSSGSLPPGISLTGDRVNVDVRHVLESHGHAEVLEHVEQMQVLSEDGRLVLAVQLRVR